jgi:hypothetical protein
MTYLEALPALTVGRENVFQLALDGKARKITIINLIILGVTFGLSDFFGAIRLNPEMSSFEGIYTILAPLLFCVVGIITMITALAGLCLIYWAAARAFGGPGGCVVILDLIGAASIPFWFLAPLLNYQLRFRQSESVSIVALVPMIVLFLWSFKLIRQSLITGQGLSEGRATMALACMWIFSISAVYVFIP